MANSLGIKFDLFADTDPAAGWLRFDAATSELFTVGWAAVVLGLIWGDTRQKR